MDRFNNYKAIVKELLRKQKTKTVPIPVERIAIALGALVRYWEFEEELSGMVYIKGSKPVIGINSRHHRNRQRFTVAHEIAHLILHRDTIGDVVHVDRKFNVLMRNADSATGTQRMEMEANSFAAELLMPTDLLVPMLKKRGFDIDDEGPLKDLSRKFQVSKQALEYRILNLIHYSSIEES